MADYDIVPEPQPRSRLGQPKIASLAGRLLHELERQAKVSARDRAKLMKLRLLIDHLLRGDESAQAD